MKKILFTLIICTFFVNVAKAECWGDEVPGNNEHIYCVSKQKMNWYSAFAWCHAQGRHLVTMNELCDYGDKIWGKNHTTCANNIAADIAVRKRAPHWSVNIDDDGNAYASYGDLYSDTNTYGKTATHTACCY